LIKRTEKGKVLAEHESLGLMYFQFDDTSEVLFTENETNFERLYRSENFSPYTKDAFHRYIVDGEKSACNPAEQGSKCAPVYRLQFGPGESKQIYLRWVAGA
jgi:hypothetical protein